MTAAILLNSARATHPTLHTTPSVGVALRELSTAARHLVSALWAAATRQPAIEARPLTATEQAEQVRAMADVQMRFDMRFAQELYAIANRHEAAARLA